MNKNQLKNKKQMKIKQKENNTIIKNQWKISYNNHSKYHRKNKQKFYQIN